MIRAIVPAKALGKAKGRLASILSAAERRDLALAMLTDVVAALRSVEEVDDVFVVSPDKAVLGLAARLGATPSVESANVTGIGQALDRAISAMSPAPLAVLVVLGDVPEAAPADIRSLLDSLPEVGAAAAPSNDGGTSALAMRPPGVMEFRFGPNSFRKHHDQARRAGVEFVEVRLDSLARDVDAPEDLARLARGAGTTETHRLLSRLGVEERVSAA